MVLKLKRGIQMKLQVFLWLIFFDEVRISRWFEITQEHTQTYGVIISFH